MSPSTSQASAPSFACVNCRQAFPQDGFPYTCPNCGGHFDFADPLRFMPPDASTNERGIVRYRQSFPLSSTTPFISLGEGDTPLVEVHRDQRTVFLKCEHLNPTGSFKDRGTAVLISTLLAQGVTSALEDSSGNAGASFAAYAARAGIEATVFVPDYASGPKVAQIQAYGARVVRILGPRSAVAEAVQRKAGKDGVYASHAYLPHGLAGMATIAYELVEQLGKVPGAIVMPVGQGTLFLGVYRGFRALHQAGVIESLPKMVGVQAQACAPIWAVFHAGAAGLGLVQEGPTLAEGIRIVHPLRGDRILAALDESGGMMVAVDEADILPARDQLAGQGLYVEPTSAVVWAAL
ncbi:MAG: pyridoxal-phosphate dependent enzyme, partial [Anaerolineales bacterium]